MFQYIVDRIACSYPKARHAAAFNYWYDSVFWYVRSSWTQKLSTMDEETHLKKQFQRLIRKCEKRHKEKLDQLHLSDPDASSTFGIDRAVLEEMWSMDNMTGKKFLLQKLKTLFYEDKVNMGIHNFTMPNLEDFPGPTGHWAGHIPGLNCIDHQSMVWVSPCYLL